MGVKEKGEIMNSKHLFLECARRNGINVADYAMTKVTDYMQAVRFFDDLRKCDVKLGMDMATLTCSGDVEVSGILSKHICLMEKDNGSNDYFKFKGMIILNGELNDPDSAPEIFIEADCDDEWLGAYAQDGFAYIREDRYLGLEIISEGRVIYDKDDIQEYLDIEEESYYNPEVSVPQLRRIVRNTRREMLVYINVQGCKKRHEGNQIVFRWNRFTCDDLIGVFSKQYKLI